MRRRHALLLAVVGISCARPPAPLQSGIALRVALASLPRFTVAGNELVPDQLTNKVVLVVFLTSWCFPCLADLPTLAKLDRDLRSLGLRILVVGNDLEGEEALLPFAQAYQLEDRLLVASPEVRRGDSPFGKIREVPSYFLFGRNGNQVVAYSGVAAPGSVEALIRKEIARGVRPP